MRKILFLGLFIIIAFTSFAQIQNKFFDCELGKATYSEALTNISNLGYSITSNERNGDMTNITILQSTYNGHNWEAISLIFYKNRFYKILFSNMSYDKEAIDETFSIFKILFTTKYKDNWYEESEDKDKLSFFDLDNEVVLYLKNPFVNNNINILVVEYNSNRINSEIISDQINSY